MESARTIGIIATEAFKNNPLVAINDGDLSRLEDQYA
jgi:hypothetical protein